MNNPILAPAAVLVLWTLIMLAWAVVTRMPALKAAGVDIMKLTGGKGADADRVLPPQTQWKAHNYNHLVEQPTLFYAVIAILAIARVDGELAIGLAWAYTLLRIAHSLVQATFNRVAVRFALFMLSTVALLGLAIIAVAETLA